MRIRPTGSKLVGGTTMSRRSDTVEQSALGGEADAVDDILGLSIARPVVDEHGHVIQNVDQVVTMESIGQARQAGLLDELRGAVYAGLYEEKVGSYLP